MVSDGVGGYHGRAELGLLRGRDQGGVSVCGLRMGPREGGKGGMGGLGWVRGHREWEIEDGVGGRGGRGV